MGHLFLGAPEMLLKENPKAVDQAQARGSRVLILAWSQSAGLCSFLESLGENPFPD